MSKNKEPKEFIVTKFTRIRTTPGNEQKLQELAREYGGHGAQIVITAVTMSVGLPARGRFRLGGEYKIKRFLKQMKDRGLMDDWHVDE
ncbi:hypothetical protein FOCG_05355 [Fusarium oxysporum f. sp. radicis-lycopersici 26381]|uniref:Uncharacterized protein n=3 Tax=Fusarium oxysporum TaxID=5507 RepID=F9F5H2_FUSOF|nr:hypothetical protein FOXB_01647 [Fusarium oxysporum f. sp. conglutinans Fo5176]EWZ30183.1 hypothetical protein FOZG_16349 [Fusarium oxysporum Fo47]EXL54488.1 hypothetical protein FOCG_05355 [Fusarium oxysporum f. sp. radicis-lycopersici 26381]EXL74167.1 hypothetical protein FOPG_10719 [Fusarium oxysporum f. sp. conglutinans race 2 54008]KAK2687806.1 hypothetical protein QWA68_013265 [Fusarium oxysporum]